MDHFEIPIEANDAGWKQRCNERMENLKTAQFPSQEASSQREILQEEFNGEKEIMIPELYRAVDEGNVDSFIYVLKQVSDGKKLPLSTIIDQVTLAGDSLLHVAADLGREQIAELIANHFPMLLTRRNIKGDTALHVAARSRSSDVIKHVDARSRSSDVIKVILSQYAIHKSKYGMEGEEITRLVNECGDTPLHEAVYSGHLGVVTDLFLKDRQVAHFLNKSSRSPLYLAVVTGNRNILQYLLSEVSVPANPPLPQCHGNSPLHAAILERKPDLLKVIRSTRPELISLRDEDGGTPLHFAAYLGYVEGIRILLNLSTPTSLQRNTKGHLPIHVACKMGHVNVVKLLLKQEWPHPKSFLNRKGRNILHVAANNGKAGVVRFLLRNKKIDRFTINEKDKDGNTPLHLASINLFPNILYYITQDKRIDVNLVNNKGLTARDVVWLAPESIRKLLAQKTLDYVNVPLKAKYILRPQPQRSPDTTSSSKDELNTYLIVATLMVTVTFAAGFTVPGGVYSSDDPNSHIRGMAVFANKSLYKLFTICNMVALGSSIVASIFLLGAVRSDRDKSRVLMKATRFCLVLAFINVPLAFTAAIRLVVPSNSSLADDINALRGMLIFYVLGYLLITWFPAGVGIPLRYPLRSYILLTEVTMAGYHNKPEDPYSQETSNDKGKDK